eukprot:738390-Pyramimonas_sp.AAC.1
MGRRGPPSGRACPPPRPRPRPCWRPWAFIEPEITVQLPGHLSPSAGLAFADIPRGLGALPKEPAAARAQILAH